MRGQTRRWLSPMLMMLQHERRYEHAASFAAASPVCTAPALRHRRPDDVAAMSAASADFPAIRATPCRCHARRSYAAAIRHAKKKKKKKKMICRKAQTYVYAAFAPTSRHAKDIRRHVRDKIYAAPDTVSFLPITYAAAMPFSRHERHAIAPCHAEGRRRRIMLPRLHTPGTKPATPAPCATAPPLFRSAATP